MLHEHWEHLMMTLAELIAANKGDASYETLAGRGGMVVSTVHKFARGQNSTFPPPETIFALARALGTSPRIVTLAAAQGLGIDMGEGRSELLPPEADRLPADAKRALVDTARAMIALAAHAPVDPEVDETAHVRHFRERAHRATSDVSPDQ